MREFKPPTAAELTATAPERAKRLVAQYDYRPRQLSPEEISTFVELKPPMPVDGRTAAERAREALAAYGTPRAREGEIS